MLKVYIVFRVIYVEAVRLFRGFLCRAPLKGFAGLVGFDCKTRAT